MKKVRVAVLYGGRSGEHEISLRSAASVIHHLDRARFEIVPIAIDKQGRWHLNDISRLVEPGGSRALDAGAVLPVFKDAPQVLLPPNPVSGGEAAVVPATAGQALSAARAFDVVFPVMHGPLCEDGTIQGLLELAEVPYVGCGVLASAAAMDKDVAKRLARDAGIPIVPYLCARPAEWRRDPAGLSARVAAELGFPCFVKPANLGSSVGVHKVKDPRGLGPALEDAFRYDSKVLVEKAISAREIEISAMENPVEGGEPLVSVAGEIVPKHEFYSYDAKYLDENGAALEIPAKLDAAAMKKAQDIARRAFAALECEGMARVDLFLDKTSGAFYLNELNTIPGFTSISMYPKMWEASGVGYSELLTKLVELALARGERRKKLLREYKPG